jgi:hypothetical protein
MKKYWIALLCLASPAFAEETSMYDSEEAFISDLEQLARRCGTMADGQVDVEIFGIKLVRTGKRCILGTGEIDPLVRDYLTTNDLAWAGLEGSDAIWVLAGH